MGNAETKSNGHKRKNRFHGVGKDHENIAKRGGFIRMIMKG
jgi:hypothetical protein